jgi:hypothetical protein
MSELTPYERPRGAIHDLSTIADLGADRCRILCVSDRTLYLLHNFAADDVTWFGRYAEERLDHGYVKLERGSPLWPLFAETVNAFQLEVLDMTCDIEAGLKSIAEALDGLCCGGGSGGSSNNAVQNCLEGLPNSELLGPDESTQGNPGIGPPPEGFLTWEEFFEYKCQAAHFIHNYVLQYMKAVQTFDGAFLVANIAVPIIAGVAGILPAALTPVGFALMVTSLVAIGALVGASWFFVDEMREYWEETEREIICALYNSSTSAQAISVVANALEDAIQAIVSWGALAPLAGEVSALLGRGFGALAGNGLVEPLFKLSVVAAQAAANCDDCESPGQGDLFYTSFASPFNVLVLGEAVVFDASSAETGYRSQNSGQEAWIEFNPDFDVDDWEWAVEWSAPNHPGETLNAVTHLDWYNPSTEEWYELEQWGPTEFDADEWTVLSEKVTEYPLDAGTLYRLRFNPQEFNHYAWVRKLAGGSA